MVTKTIRKILKWYEENLSKIFLLLSVHLISTYISNIPYINLLNIYISYFVYVADWVFIVFVFKPNKELILKFGLSLFFFNFLISFLHKQQIVELLGNISYLLLATYILLSMNELRKKKIHT